MMRGAGGRARSFTSLMCALALCGSGATIAIAQPPPPVDLAVAADSVTADARPFVPGGYDDKPYLTGLFGRISVGGYVEAHAVHQWVDGVVEESGFLLERWNLLASSRVGDRIQVWAEVEFEDGGSNIVLELAQIDLEFHPSVNLRGGMLLLPIGRFNLAHDGPRNPFTDRPLLATDLLGTALSMPGFGAFGKVPLGTDARATYELYAVNGYTDGLLLDSPDGTRLPFGSKNPEDANASPALVSRIAWSPGARHEVGVSAYGGAYNVYRVDGLHVDERRSVRIAAFDARTTILGVDLNGELTAVHVEIPSHLTSVYASRQGGFFVDATRAFGHGYLGGMPEAYFSAGLRFESVDLDRDLEGDSSVQLSAGANLHPTSESVLKLDYQRSRSRDRFNNLSEGAAIKLSLTTYF